MAKILIVEDDAVSLKLAKSIVEGCGHTVFASPNGRHAYETLTADNRFDLLITDVLMPVMDGRELIKTLRADPRFEGLPVAIMSAAVSVGEISDLLKLGATWFLAKPLQRKDLEHYLHRCLVRGECAMPSDLT